MDVRQARPTDAPMVLALALDDGAHLVKDSAWPARNPVLSTVVRALLPPLAMSGRLWVASEGSSRALLEAHPRRYVLGWDITRLAVRGQVESVIAPVVQAATVHLQSRRVPRLFARCQTEASGGLQALGFQVLAREHLMIGPQGRASRSAPVPIDSRYRMPQDAWPLHQLESEITPPLVRHLEGLSSVDWSDKPRERSEIVVERDGRIVAWVGWGDLGRKRAQMGHLLHPDHADLGPHLLEHVLERAMPNCRLFARVRDYQTETIRVYEEAGFTVAAEEVLMVKHAGVELAPALQRTLKVAHVPSMQALPIRLHDGRQPALQVLDPIKELP
jgi:hypothetical protein